MKVVFLQDVPNVARVGEMKEVANGYARNFLIPKKLAILATPSTTGILGIQHKIEAREQEQEEARLVELARQLEGKEINLKARAGAKDRLYGSITNADIASELSNAGVVIDKRTIELAESIRQLGSYEITVRLAKDITPKIKVTVIEEETEKEEETKKGKPKRTRVKKEKKGEIKEEKPKRTRKKKEEEKGEIKEEKPKRTRKKKEETE